MKRTLRGLGLGILTLVMIGCSATVSSRKMVDVSYKGTLENGSVFSQSDPSKPLEFLVGAGTIIPTLEKGMMGMKVGDKKTISVKAADAYGEYDKAALRVIPRAQFPKDLPLKVGAQYQVNNGQGGPMVITISAVTDKDVTVDFNHPLAGKNLTFEVTIVKIRDATKDEMAQLLAAASAHAQAAAQAAAQAQPAKQ
jgi:FKBP-type peptidyl-prolyl cis-trans isomerase 2